MKNYIITNIENFLNENANLDIQINKEANNIQNKILNNILKDNISFQLLNEDDFLTTSTGKNIKLNGIKFNLNQIDKKYNLNIIFCENNIGNMGGGFHANTNSLIFPIFEKPYVNRSMFPEDIPQRKEYTIEDYKYSLKIRFKPWIIEENIFIHEFIHYLDKNRYKNTYTFSKPKNKTEYYNSPEEYNAFSQEIIKQTLKNKNKLIGLPFNSFLKKTLKFAREEFINNLNDDYMRKLKNRLYKIYSEFNKK